MERTAALLCVFAILAAPALAAQQDSLHQRLSAMQTKRQYELQTSNKLALSGSNWLVVIVECGTDSLEQLVQLAGGLSKEWLNIVAGFYRLSAKAATCVADYANNISALIDCEQNVAETALSELKVLEEKAGGVLNSLSSILSAFNKCVVDRSSA